MRAWERYGDVSRAVFVAATIVGAFASEAAAQECQADADCGAGYECEVYSGMRCSGERCAPGQVCPPPVCETFTYGRCVNAPCDADADCPDPMLCHAETTQECSGGAAPRPACPPGVSCEPAPPPEPPVCTERTVTSCRQPYELPCTQDADCGGGFRCIEEVSHWCNGSSGTTRPPVPVDDDVPVDGGAGVPLPPDTVPPLKPECGSTPTGRFYCELQVIACAADSECPSGLVCVDNPSSVVCDATEDLPASRDAGVAPALEPSTQPGTGVAADPIEGAPVPATPAVPPTCETIPADPPKVCRPRHWDGGFPGTPGKGSPSSGRGDASDDDEAAEDPVAPPSPGGDGTAKPPTAGERSAARREKLREVLRRMFRNHEGCSVAHEDARALDLSWLLIAGALAAVATRRRR